MTSAANAFVSVGSIIANGLTLKVSEVQRQPRQIGGNKFWIFDRECADVIEWATDRGMTVLRDGMLTLIEADDPETLVEFKLKWVDQ